MNILFLLKTLDLGGVEIVSATLANYFCTKGHKVVVFAFEEGNGSALNYFKNAKIEIGYGYSYNKKNLLKLNELINNAQIQIVINQWGLPFLPINILCRLNNRGSFRIISTHHNIPSSNGLLKNVEMAFAHKKGILNKCYLKCKWLIFKMITSCSMRYVYNHSDKYMVLSPCYIEHFKKFTGIKNPTKLLVQTNPVTIDTSGFTFNPANKQKEIIYVGRIDYNQKRVYRVIDTWALLENRFPDWRLIIVGDGPERVNIETQVREKGLKHVSFEGFQHPIEYYKRASLLMLTSEYEGFPLVLAECMSFGVVPAVYGSYSAVYDIIENGKNGIILPADKVRGFDAAMMAERMAAIMESPETLQTLAIQAMKKSKEYSLDKIAKQWEEVMGEISQK